VVVVGGGIARSAELFLPIAQRHLQDLKLRLVPSTLFDRAQLVGAAAYWRDERIHESAGHAEPMVSKDSIVAS
jgi:glucokinase